MTNDTRALGSALRRLSSVLLRLSDQDLIKLSDSSYDIEIKFIKKKSKESSPNEIEVDLDDIVRKLTSSSSREVALDFLHQNYKSKKPLELIARKLDIPILKQDKADSLRDKIVEATAGARLRSEAIKGTD
ncbi:TPA: hypothetical protein OUI97_003642 [Pseudomonas aeruginosa]|uniref:hypothetical protein n=1 Tax=Pseudomonas TaxID=286 RepID=UPI000F529F58|nr:MULTISPECIES: hypothetical protein [Pseudomonas]ELO1026028.1 hypothetical protein [Pseudomonas aeruginosa]MBD1328232.1 hypothetical protein [Pseudomonas aeruginosa]MBG5000531.1 hypothetical protein [Pseudomonas aeruginosa]MBG6706906.1 hypothetical protein [Pseudomonas aeruginosa]MBG6764583.1 hypothetical protein [Pseudomonas aeruginosa]